jgi:DNA-binding PadR family transcriptional regulator
MKLENILLGVLLQHPSTGYDLKKFLDTSGRFLRSNTQMSQVYRSLTRMEELGWVVHTVETRPGQDAKTYRVTEEGATVFLDWLKGPYQPPSRFEDPDFMARLSFAGFMEIDEVIALLDTELDARHAQIARYRFRDRTLPAADTSVPFDQTLAVPSIYTSPPARSYAGNCWTERSPPKVWQRSRHTRPRPRRTRARTSPFSDR